MGKGTIGSEGETRQKTFIGVFVLVGEEVAQSQVEVGAGIGGVVVVGIGGDVGDELAAVSAEVDGQWSLFDYVGFVVGGVVGAGSRRTPFGLDEHELKMELR